MMELGRNMASMFEELKYSIRMPNHEALAKYSYSFNRRIVTNSSRPFRRSVKERFNHFLVLEYQDLSSTRTHQEIAIICKPNLSKDTFLAFSQERTLRELKNRIKFFFALNKGESL